MDTSALEQVAQTGSFWDNTMTWFILGGVLGLACIVFGIVLLTGSKEFLTTNRFISGGKHRRPSSMPVYRLTGVQMVLMGVILIVCVIGFALQNIWIGLPTAIILVFLPLPFSSYMKRSKKFNAGHLSNTTKKIQKNSPNNEK